MTEIVVKKITPLTENLRLPNFAYTKAHYSPEDCVNLIRSCPDEVMKQEHGLILDTAGDTDWIMLETARTMYSNTADWLEYYLLNNTKVLPELDSTCKKHYKSLAEISIATLKLAQEICLFCPWQDQENLSPTRWWLACEWEFCYEILQNSGVTSEAIGVGSRTYYENQVKQNREIDKLLVNKTTRNLTATQEITISEARPIQALEGLAFFIASTEENKEFRNNYYYEYRKSLSRCARKLRDSPLNPLYLVNNTIRRMGRGKGFRPKKSL